MDDNSTKMREIIRLKKVEWRKFQFQYCHSVKYFFRILNYASYTDNVHSNIHDRPSHYKQCECEQLISAMKIYLHYPLIYGSTYLIYVVVYILSVGHTNSKVNNKDTPAKN